MFTCVRLSRKYSVFFKPVRQLSSKKCIIYTTAVKDPFYNLAFEEWMFNKVDFTKTNCLFIWSSNPTVVIGRHQNPWRECKVDDAIADGVNICRRSSGGGAVYHDLGNLNFTFFNEKSEYNTKHNLGIITQGLQEHWPHLDVAVNKRDDILLNASYKISGTAARLGRRNCYHHCTLLVSTNKSNLMKYLYPNEMNLISIVTESVRSSVMNLEDEDSRINCENVSKTVAQFYAKQYINAEHHQIDTKNNHFLPGIDELAESLSQWNWVYGKTPKFTCVYDYFYKNTNQSYPLHFEVKGGLISKVTAEEYNVPFSTDEFIGKRFTL